MDWDQNLIDRLDLAFNESQVCGLQFDQARSEARLLVEVLALPEVGPIDPDPRRVVVYADVSAVEVTLRRDEEPELGPALPLESLDGLESFWGSLKHVEPMYGWRFVDIVDPGEIWNGSPSLVLPGSHDAPTSHTMRWFVEMRASRIGRPMGALLPPGHDLVRRAERRTGRRPAGLGGGVQRGRTAMVGGIPRSRCSAVERGTEAGGHRRQNVAGPSLDIGGGVGGSELIRR